LRKGFAQLLVGELPALGEQLREIFQDVLDSFDVLGIAVDRQAVSPAVDLDIEQ
jgi:hypothetical protein